MIQYQSIGDVGELDTTRRHRRMVVVESYRNIVVVSRGVQCVPSFCAKHSFAFRVSAPFLVSDSVR